MELLITPPFKHIPISFVPQSVFLPLQICWRHFQARNGQWLPKIRNCQISFEGMNFLRVFFFSFVWALHFRLLQDVLSWVWLSCLDGFSSIYRYTCRYTYFYVVFFVFFFFIFWSNVIDIYENKLEERYAMWLLWVVECENVSKCWKRRCTSYTV